MDYELYLLLRGAVIGILATIIVELMKHRLERIRSADHDDQTSKRKQAEKICKFLSGENQSEPGAHPPYPAWLRQMNVATRKPLARMGLRRDEDFGTALFRVAPDVKPGRKILTRLKSFGPDSFGPDRFGVRRSSRPSGKKFLLGPSHVIGRGSRCDIQVLDPTVSLIHALIRFEETHFVLYDLGSTSGTYVDEKSVDGTGIALLGGETIRMGATSFEFGRVITPGEIEQVDPFFIL